MGICYLRGKHREGSRGGQESRDVSRCLREASGYLVPSGSFLSKEVLRGMAAWACGSNGWHCRRSGVPGTGEALETGCRAGVGTRCHVVFLLKGVLYSQGVPSLSSLYSTMGIRQSSEQPLSSQEEVVSSAADTGKACVRQIFPQCSHA